MRRGNLSPKQLLQKGLATSVQKILSKSGLESRFLKVEITETAIIDDLHHKTC